MVVDEEADKRDVKEQQRLPAMVSLSRMLGLRFVMNPLRMKVGLAGRLFADDDDAQSGEKQQKRPLHIDLPVTGGAVGHRRDV